MDKYNELKELILELEEDAIKFFEKGNKSAGTRVRKSLQDVKKIAQDLRISIQEIKKA